MNTFITYRDTIRDTSFCDAITNIYDAMVLKIFINTIANPHVKRLSGHMIWVQPTPGQWSRCCIHGYQDAEVGSASHNSCAASACPTTLKFLRRKRFCNP